MEPGEKKIPKPTPFEVNKIEDENNIEKNEIKNQI